MTRGGAAARNIMVTRHHSLFNYQWDFINYGVHGGHHVVFQKKNAFFVMFSIPCKG